MSTENKKIFNPRGGRPIITDGSKLSNRIDWRLNDLDYQQLVNDFESTGLKTMAGYLRLRLIKTKDLYVNNPLEILKTLDAIGERIGKVGNNINQLAKYANTLQLKGKLEPGVMDSLNQLLREYGKERKEIARSIRVLLRRKRD